jgi:septal ring factor EnvC (AmiA/AmiB activator)
MLSFSDPVELKRLSNLLQWAAIALVFCGGVLQLLRFVVDQREKTISAALAQQREAAQMQRDKETGERLSQAQNEIARLEAQRQELVARLQSDGEEIEGVKGSLAKMPTFHVSEDAPPPAGFGKDGDIWLRVEKKQ